MLFIPALTLLKYEGEAPRPLWEVKGLKKKIILKRGDTLLLPTTTAILMSRRRLFTIVETPSSFVNETINKTQDEKDALILDLNEQITALKELLIDQNGDDAANAHLDDVHAPKNIAVDDTTPLPSIEELELMDDEKLKEVCATHNIKVGKKAVKTLKAELFKLINKD